MHSKIKKIIIELIVSILTIMNAIPINVYAATTYVTGSKIHSNWWLAEPSSGRRDNKEAELLINGERAFCIDAFTKFKSGVTMKTVDWNTVGINKNIAEELSLIAYFGTKVNGRTSDDWYAITQGLIWKVRHEAEGHTDMCYVETPTNPDYNTTVKCWNEILNDVKAYKMKPSFSNDSYDMNAGDTLTLTDTNASLSNMIIKDDSGLDVSISENNKLIIKANEHSKTDATITLQRNIKASEVGTSLVFYNGKDQSLAQFKIDKPMEIKLNIHVNKFGSLELIKTNIDASQNIPNTEFKITGPNGFNETYTTDTNGMIKIDELPLGDYIAQETKAAQGYLINVTEFGFTIKPNETTQLKITNREPTAIVHLKKDDKEMSSTPQGDATLAGAKYQLIAAEDIYNKAHTHKFYSKDEIVATRVTDNKGNMDDVTDLPLGHYQFKEVTPSNGYLLDTTIYDVHCDYEDQNVEVIVRSVKSLETVKKQAFQIIKVSTDESEESELLAGAEFTVKLTSEVKKVGWNKAKIYDILTTDKKGYAKSIELPYGTYTVKETKIPDNVMPVPDFTVVIENDSREPQTWRVFNDAPFKALIKAVKADAETGKTVLLPDTEFKIKNVETGEYVGQWVWFPIPHFVDTFTTDESGTVTTPNTLECGEYELIEVKSPYGYLLDDEPIRFTVSTNTAYEIAEDGKTPVITVMKEDISAKGQIEVSKIGEQLIDIFTDKDGNIQFHYEKKPVDGAKFVVKADEDIFSADNQRDLIYKKDEVVSELTTSNGKDKTDKLPLGKYKIYEVVAGDGFVLNKEIKDIELTYKDQYTPIIVESAEYENTRQKVDLKVLKLDSETETLLSGAEFGLYAKKDIYGYKEVSSMINDSQPLVKAGTLIEKAISDENGNVIFKTDLPLSLFEIKELKAPIGYASNDEVYEVDASYQGQDVETIKVTYEVLNEITKVEISKQDITTGKELAGAHMVVKEKEGSIFDTWVSTNEPHLIKGLEPNKTYELIETNSPYGFALAQKIEFTVKDTGEVQKVEMKDELVKGNLKWQKTGEVFTHTITSQNEFGTTHTPVWEKQNLLNAKITIYAAEDITLGNGVTYWHKDEAIETLTSDWDAVMSQDLLVGKYYYVESSDLHGYVTDTQKHYFEIEDNQSTEIQLVESTLENKRPTVEVKFTKYMESLKDHEELNAYQDVIFGIYAREDIYDYMGNVAIPYGTLIDTTGIDELGQFDHFPDLPNGVYYVKELQTNKMYNLDETEYDFEIAWHSGDVSRYTINIGSDEGIVNELQRGKVIIHKTDLDTKEALKDVEFVMSTDKDFTHIVDTVKTDDKGIAEFNELELGYYFIKENSVDGYVTNTHIYEVDITKDGDELTIDVENKPLEMEFSKVDITNNKELEGAKLQVIDKEAGKVIDEWISTKEIHKIKYLVEGKEYIMKEIIAPNGYAIAESITFKAEDGVKIIMKDKLIPEIPQTGDSTDIGFWLSALGIAVIGLLGGIYVKRKEYSNNE
ncbi:hypothetical protein IMSAGC017_00778 [Thomasclavelia cocleata]|uniref:LPXTG-motif cell wall anchor domain-containing protein n=1 Tax=Thomasclavelia cocleata TaxID=69824 RepID=A0A829Z8S7_9FIRM|nr:SpaA isopeptide-forming pilin-related protein [Thomasclavelia cocleata]MDE6952757.1 Cys-Gln thioester bond-forming surface protein [Erysipelotrichales bacterium]GFI40743.1 hypothetical protein IMSAGC017_00778 [Thomasclavelia cocleata]